MVRTVADTGPLLCHGTLPSGPQRMLEITGRMAYVQAVASELAAIARRNPADRLAEAAKKWVGRHINRLGELHDLQDRTAAVSDVQRKIRELEADANKPGRYGDANLGEAQAIVATLDVRGRLLANDSDAREAASMEGVRDIWTSVDVLRHEVRNLSTTAVQAYADYRLMITRGFDPGEPIAGALDL